MKSIWVLLLFLFVIVSSLTYIFLINSIYNSLSQDSVFNDFVSSNTIISDSPSKVDMSMTAAHSVGRTRWYGKITETGNKSFIKFLFFVPLPLSVNDINFVMIHIFALMLLVFVVIFSLLLFERGNSTNE